MKKSNRNLASEPIVKLESQGKSMLSDSEILCVIGQIDLLTAQQILIEADYDLSNLAKWTIIDWMKFEGIGAVKASSLIASFELGRRRQARIPRKKERVNQSADIYNLMKPIFQDEIIEYFYIVMLTRANEIIKPIKISTGGTTAAIADPKIIFKHALEHNASAIILVHNHPSGNTKPSDADRRLTEKLKSAGNFLDVPVLDHVIYTDHGYFSFADEGLL
jgi:DNA repair protein RadC